MLKNIHEAKLLQPFTAFDEGQNILKTVFLNFCFTRGSTCEIIHLNFCKTLFHVNTALLSWIIRERC